jgi:hypothetical protein
LNEHIDRQRAAQGDKSMQGHRADEIERAQARRLERHDFTVRRKATDGDQRAQKRRSVWPGPWGSGS